MDSLFGKRAWWPVVLIVLLLLALAGCSSTGDSGDGPVGDELAFLVVKNPGLQTLTEAEAAKILKVVERRAQAAAGDNASARWQDDSRRRLLVSGLADQRGDRDLRRTLSTPGTTAVSVDVPVLGSYPTLYEALANARRLAERHTRTNDDESPWVNYYLFGPAPDRNLLCGPCLAPRGEAEDVVAVYSQPPGADAWPPAGAEALVLPARFRLIESPFEIGTEGASGSEWLLTWLREQSRTRVPPGSLTAETPAATRTRVSIPIQTRVRRTLSKGVAPPPPPGRGAFVQRVFLFQDDRIVSSAEISKQSSPLPGDPSINQAIPQTITFDEVSRDDWRSIEIIQTSGPLPPGVELVPQP